MKKVLAGAAAAGVLLLAGAQASAAGYNGSFDGLKTALAEAVAAGDKTAVKMDQWITKDSTALSKDFKTLSKVAKLAAKDDYQVVSREDLEALFAQMILATYADQLKVAGRIAELTNDLTNQNKLAKLGLFIGKKLQGIEKIGAVWVEGDPTLANLSKAAKIYAKLQKAWEAFLRKYGEPAAV